MNFNKIKSLQKTYNFEAIQNQINSGAVWKLEGSSGRYAMELLISGACMLPKESRIDYYGNQIPSRDNLKKGSKGTYQNSKNFWTKVYEGEIVL